MYIVLSVLSCIGFLITKILVNQVSLIMKLQFMTQVFGVGFAIFALMAGNCYEEKISKAMSTKVGKIIRLVSKCSLEIFLVQFAIIEYLKPIVFPVNMILIVMAIVLIAWIVHLVAERMYKLFIPLLRFER